MRCGRRVGRQYRDERTAGCFGLRSRRALRASAQRLLPVCHLPSVFGGSVRTAACHQRSFRHQPSPCLDGICPSWNAKRLRYYWLRGSACERSLNGWAVPPRQSHVRLDATRPRGVVVSYTGPQRRNGTLKDLLADRRLPSWPSMLRYGSTFRIAWRALSRAQAGRLSMGRQ
jgi:hypothetical protein